MSFNNIWGLAEAFVQGTLSPEDLAELRKKLDTDIVFANEFNENLNLINSLNAAGKETRFKSMLTGIHATVASKPAKHKTITIHLPTRFWRNSAVAAGVALLTVVTSYMAFVNSTKKSTTEYNTISREVEHLKREQQKQKETQNALLDTINKRNPPPPSDVRYTGTGFAITNDGYFVTANHVIHDGKSDFDSIYIHCSNDQYYKAFVVMYSAKSDIALLKVEKKNFKFSKTDLPYTFATSRAGLGAKIFTLGYPKDDVVYSEGYISGRNGVDGNDEQYTLELPAGHGQSGSPLVDNNGEIQGLLTAISNPSQSNTFAVNTPALLDLLHQMPNGNNLHLPKSNKLKSLPREKQIEKIEEFTFSVKVYK